MSTQLCLLGEPRNPLKTPYERMARTIPFEELTIGGGH